MRPDQLSGRRRRLLTEEAFQAAPAPAAVPRAGTGRPGTGRAGTRSASEPRPARNVAAPRRGLLMEQLPRLSDMIPQRAATLVLIGLAGLAIISLLAAAHVRTAEFRDLTTDGSIEAFDLDREGTVAAWFSSFLLSASALMSLALFAIGKRHVHDYHARYRMWGWAAVVFLTLSIDETGSLHEGFKELMTRLTGNRLTGDGSLWWVIAYGIVLLPLAGMMWHRTRHSWTARGFFVGTAIAWTVAVLCQGQWFLRLPGQTLIVLEESCEMLGHLGLLLGLTIHAGHSLHRLGTGGPAKRKAAAKSSVPPPKGRTRAAAAKSPARPTRTRRPKGAEAAEDDEATTEPAGTEDSSLQAAGGELASPGGTATTATSASASAGKNDPPSQSGKSDPRAGKSDSRPAETRGAEVRRPTPEPVAEAPRQGSAEAPSSEEDDDRNRTSGETHYRVDDAEDVLEDGRGTARKQRKEKRRQGRA